MNFSLLDVYLQRNLKGFTLGYLSLGGTETALAALMVGKGVTPDGTLAIYITFELLFFGLIKNTYTSFLDLFKKEDDDEENN